MTSNSLTDATLPRVVPRLRQERPASLYDNLRGSGTMTNGSAAGGVGTSPVVHNHPLNGGATGDVTNGEVFPTQTHLMRTTVPQNIAATAIAGRHAPTRNSLRHSRMIVLNRSAKVQRKHHPHVMRHHRLGRALAALQALIGGAVTTLAMWLIIWTPRLPTRDVPYWSGLPLLLSGILGLMLLCCCRKDYPGKPYSCHTFIFKTISLVVSIAAGGTCFCAGAFAFLHLLFLSRAVCEPMNVLNATCVCRSVADSENVLDITAKVSRYQDLNCPEVENILSVLLIGSSAANLLGGLLVAWYVYLHWSSRYAYIYSQVKTGDDKPIIITNKV
ncbi:hypothetical protein LSTR_LSTR007925 [Laodelphax striatellus]|uniref:Sarcospan n=1 Tax=Laodelphax striatellus TaxID=195883 RepID=A0A482XKR7_LAOST|nr:hypothetical protein LSTR_LSTR007925 [Laodelphax striatellus]